MVITRTTRNRLSGNTLRGFESHHLRHIRGISAVGSASHWQCGGQGFESPMLHQLKRLYYEDFRYRHFTFIVTTTPTTTLVLNK